MKVSVVLPSRCEVDPRSVYESLFLERALQSVRNQTVKVHEVCIGVQQVHPRLDRLLSFYEDWQIQLCQTTTKGQAAALNVAATAATGDVIAFLEDDDLWQPLRLWFGLKALKECSCEFVSSNQLEVNLHGKVVQLNDFATPSGWLLSTDLWRRTGGFDETFRWHMDTEFLGKLTKSGVNRVHLVEHDAKVEERPGLAYISKFSRVFWTSESSPLVLRLRNPKGGISAVTSDAAAKAESVREENLLIERYGAMPW